MSLCSTEGTRISEEHIATASICCQELRRKRAELSLTLRKQAREEQLLKRRAVSPEGGAPEPADELLMTPEEIVQGNLLRTSEPSAPLAAV